jgi:phospholipid/cholesterol/gamma-HCH transport system substrate-binding protein
MTAVGMRRGSVLWLVALGVAVVVIAVAAISVLRHEDTYRLQILMPTAEGTFPGGSVKMRGEDVGTVSDVAVTGNKALVTVELQDDAAPLHVGTTARISWQAVLNERFVDLLPGPATAPAIPSGTRIESTIERVELDEVLATLDPTTLNNVNALVPAVADALKGREQKLRQTLQYGGPAIDSLGQVLQAVGSDGPAIRDLVHQLHGVTDTLASRDDKLAGTISNLGRITAATAAQQRQLSDGLAELPSTLDTAKTTLDKVPDAVDAAVPLVDDLRPAAARLPGVAADLRPVLHQLRPIVPQLRSTLKAVTPLLDRTPGLLDAAHGTMPDLTGVVRRIQPAVTYLRPYIPEAAGWFSNWTSIWSGVDGTGNYARPVVTTGSTALGDNPTGVLPPGIERSGQNGDGRPRPGEIVNQPWTDANQTDANGDESR